MQHTTQVPKPYQKAHKEAFAIKDYKARRTYNPNGYELGQYDNQQPNKDQYVVVNPHVENVVRIVVMGEAYEPYRFDQISVLNAYDAANTLVEVGWMTAKNKYPHMDGFVRSRLIQRNVHSQELLRTCLNTYYTTEQGSAPLAFYNERDADKNPHRVPILMPLEALYVVVEDYLFPTGCNPRGGQLIAENAVERIRKEVHQ